MSKYNYTTIKALAEQNSTRVTDLLALAQQNDPFYVGAPATMAAAQWFTDLWHKFNYDTGVHLRRIHYRLVSQDPPALMPNGLPYENNLNCWAFLNQASKYARYLKLVDPDAFIDRRNPEAIIFTSWNQWARPDPGYQVYGPWSDYGYDLPRLPELPRLPGKLPELPHIAAGGYDDIQQDYHLEIWAEKTTMNDILEPICREYQVNLVTGAGELSITAVRQFLQRVEEARRPARILYISDFDPAGLGMPISVARKVEFYQRNDGCEDLDIALQPIVLTADQVGSFRLPRVPVKDSDLRKAHFEESHGEGQVELDALEALYPGELARIVTDEILRYYDPDLSDKAQEQKAELQQELDNRWQIVTSEYSKELGALEGEYQALVSDFDKTRAEFTELASGFAPKLEAHRERLEAIKQRAQEVYGKLYEALEDTEIDLDDYPLPEPDIEGDPDGLLYASERDYLDQLEAYKYQRNGA